MGKDNIRVPAEGIQSVSWAKLPLKPYKASGPEGKVTQKLAKATGRGGEREPTVPAVGLASLRQNLRAGDYRTLHCETEQPKTMYTVFPVIRPPCCLFFCTTVKSTSRLGLYSVIPLLLRVSL